jgi:hypothetical protein
MPDEKKPKVLIVEGDYASLERRVAALLVRRGLDVVSITDADRRVNAHRRAFPEIADWTDRTRAMQESFAALYAPREERKAQRFLKHYGMPVGKIRDCIDVRSNAVRVDVPLYSITVSEVMIDTAERVLALHVEDARARTAATRVRLAGASLTGRLPSAPPPQFLGAGGPGNPRKTGG